MKDLKKNILVLKYVITICPFYALFTLFHIIAQTIHAVANVYIVKVLVNIVTNLVSQNDTNIKKIILVIAFYILIIIVCLSYSLVYNSYIKGKYRLIFAHKMRNLMFKKTATIDYESFDNPQFYDMYSRAMRDGVQRGLKVYDDITGFISALVTTIALGAIIVVENYVILLIIIISIIIRVIIGNFININSHKHDVETETDRRMYGYVKRTFYQERFAQEIKATPISELLIEKCYDAKKNIEKSYRNTHGKNVYLNGLSIIVNSVFEMGGVYVYLIYLLFKGLSLDIFSEMVSATKQFSNTLYQMATFINKIKLNALYIDFFLDYMNYKPKLETVGTLDLPNKFNKIEVKNLTFNYPNCDFNALENINLTLHKNEKIAIVGLNGAGKTTLIKLLLKFYNPTSGAIYYNDIDIKEVKEDVIRRKYSILFQDYRIYGVTIGENILMRKVSSKEDEEIIYKALEYVNMKERIIALPQGINTMCTKEFRKDGAEFSGGELQRLALARVFASNAEIYVLDEPTSALDPLAEYNINKLIMEKSPNKAIILIAHRLSTVVDADRIILIEYGKIIEEGTHKELMQKKGKYYEMFTSQGQLYKKKN